MNEEKLQMFRNRLTKMYRHVAKLAPLRSRVGIGGRRGGMIAGGFRECGAGGGQRVLL